jgi:hypothetical protein
MIHRSRFRRACVAALAVLAGASLFMSPAEVEAQPATSSKPAIFHNGIWYLRNSLTTGAATSSFSFGRAGDIPLMGDWDGDGDETIGVARLTQLPTGRYTFTWHLRDSNNGGPVTVPSFTYPSGPGYDFASDLYPFVGDWNGDGIDTVGVMEHNSPPDRVTRWDLRNSNTTGLPEFGPVYGRDLDIPVIGDWDGDGDDTLGVVRGDRWLLSNDLAGGGADHSVVFGSELYTELPVVGDWDGDGDDTLAILRNVPPSQNVGGFERWLYSNSLGGGAASGEITFGSDAFAHNPDRLPRIVPRLSWR